MERLQTCITLHYLYLLRPPGSTNLQVKVLRISRRRRCSFVVKVLGMSVGNLKPSESIREFPKIGGTLFRGPYNKDPTI